MTDVVTNDEGVKENTLFETVVQGGYCIGCGACAAVQGASIEVRLNTLGCFEAVSTPGGQRGGVEEIIANVCPFSDQARNETEIGRDLFGDSVYDEHIGYYRSAYAGYVAEGNFRALGSSGGMGKWILAELLRTGQVDAVIQVHAEEPSAEGLVYRYQVARSVEEVRTGSKSVYYPVEMAEVLAYVCEYPGRYAITGIPCFIKAVRLLAEQEPVVKERIVFCVGLICGHLKSLRYADMIAWQFGVQPGDLAAIDFRKKLPSAKANEKGVAVESIRQEENVKDPDVVQHLFGTNYNHGFFQYKACDFCDDVVGETADISVGDAWLPEYLSDGNGTSVVVVRHPVIEQLVQHALEEGRLHLEPLDAARVAQSQAGGFRQRREGLAYRLHLADEQAIWRPQKRVSANAKHLSRKRKAIYRLRSRMSEQSHHAFRRALEQRDFTLFRQEMVPLLAAYQELYKPTLWHRIKRGLQRRGKKIGQKLGLGSGRKVEKA